jgi:uncharacterized protein (TIGR02270 family)
MQQVALIPEIAPQFAENSAALWEQRERAACGRLYRSHFADLCDLDSRIDAQIDGLRVSGSEGWRVASEALELQGAGEIFTASILAFECRPATSPDPDPVTLLIGSITKPAMAVRPMAAALDWIAPLQIHAAIKRMCADRLPFTRAVTLMSMATCRIDCTDRIIVALREENGVVVHSACSAALQLGAREAVPSLDPWLESENAETRFTAARASLLLGGARASRVLEVLASAVSCPLAEEASTTLFHACPPDKALSLHRELFRGNISRTSVQAAGSAGLPALIPFLLECLDLPPLARLAAEAISKITGVDLIKARLTTETPEATGGPSEDPGDPDIAIDPDEGLPCPKPAAVKSWWQIHSPNFAPMTRYLSGRVVDSNSLGELVQTGLQTRRAAAAELLALSGQPLLDVQAPAFRQAERLRRGEPWR